ncbi:MAG: hypothetical protein ACI9NT_002334 [Bacteroidia bacterium]|jgi:hypothetical protein
MKRAITAVLFTCLLTMAGQSAAVSGGSLDFRCGLRFGDTGMDYKPSQGWKKKPDAFAARYSESHFRRSHSVVFLKPGIGRSTLAMAQPSFEVERQIAPPLGIGKAGCTWR